MKDECDLSLTTHIAVLPGFCYTNLAHIFPDDQAEQLWGKIHEPHSVRDMCAHVGQTQEFEVESLIELESLKKRASHLGTHIVV